MSKLALQDKIKRSENFMTAKVDDDIVMMSIEQGSYFSLDSIGSAIWADLARPTQINALCKRLVTRYQVEQTRCEADVLHFLDEMVAVGMIEVVA